MKSIRQHRRAQLDILQALDYYRLEAGTKIAESFVLSIEASMDRLSRFPSMGSPHFGLMLNIPGLRTVLTPDFPYTVFYFERDAHVDVVRVLHQRRDIPSLLSEDVETSPES